MYFFAVQYYLHILLLILKYFLVCKHIETIEKLFKLHKFQHTSSSMQVYEAY